MDYELRKYKRVHKFSNPFDVEKGKVTRDRAKFLKEKKRAQKACQEVLRSQEEDVLDGLIELDTNVERARRGFKTHKTRLKKLLRQKEFE